MAKGGFLAGMAAVIYSTWRRSQKQRLQAEENFRKAVRNETRKVAKDQAEYEAYVKSARVLEGNGRYDQRVYLGDADQFALESYAQYIELMQTKDTPFAVLLVFDEESEVGKVRVEGGQATLGHLYYADEDEFIELLEVHNPLAANAKLEKLVSGEFELWLDVGYPLKLEK